MDEFEADNKTPKYVHCPDSVAFLRAAADKLDRRNIGQNRIETLTAIYAAKAECRVFQFSELEVTQQIVYALQQGDKLMSPKVKTDRLRLMWVWLHNDFKDIVDDIKTSPVDYSRPSALARELNGFLTPGSQLDTATLGKLRGRYLIYRRFYRLPRKVMISELTCGVHALDQFTVTMPYNLPGGIAPQDPADGCIVPYPGGALFQGRFTEMGGPFVFTLTHLHFNGPGNSLSIAEGVLLAAAKGGMLASSYPLLVVRSENEAPLGVVDVDKIEEDEELWLAFKPIYLREYVKWQG